MHEVQAWIRLRVPFTTARTVWMFGFQRRRVRRCEWEMELPKPGPLPQTSQLAATEHTPAHIGTDDPYVGRRREYPITPRWIQTAERPARVSVPSVGADTVSSWQEKVAAC